MKQRFHERARHNRPDHIQPLQRDEPNPQWDVLSDRPGSQRDPVVIFWRSIWARVSSSDAIMNSLSRRPYAEPLSVPYRDHFRRWPISAGKLVSLIDLSWSDYRIASYFGVEPVKVSALRTYYGLVDYAQDSRARRMRGRNCLESDG
jgi:hypothetical protein